MGLSAYTSSSTSELFLFLFFIFIKNIEINEDS